MKRLLLTALLVTAITSAATAKAPKKKPVSFNDISIMAVTAGDGFGWRYIPTAGILFGKSTIAYGGPVICGTDRNVSGFLLGTRYVFMPESKSYSGHVRIAAGFSVQRFNETALSPLTVSQETMRAHVTEAAPGVNFVQLKYSGWEYASTATLTYRFGFGLLLRGEAGLMYYTTKESDGQPVPTFRDKSDFGVRIGAGLGWSF